MELKLLELDLLVKQHLDEESISKDECIKTLNEMDFHGDKMFDQGEDDSTFKAGVIMLYGSFNSMFDADKPTERLQYDKVLVQKVVSNLLQSGIWIEGCVDAEWANPKGCEYADFDFFLCAMAADGILARASEDKIIQQNGKTKNP